MGEKLKVGLACDARYMDRGIKDHEVESLNVFATFEWREFNETSDWYSPPISSEEVVADFIEFASAVDAMVVCHGAPRVTRPICAWSENWRETGLRNGSMWLRVSNAV